MSDKTYGSIVTKKGAALNAASVLAEEGGGINITHFAVGDGGGAYYVPTDDMEALKNETWRGTIRSAFILPDERDTISVSAIVPKEVGGFFIRETAIFDDAGNMIGIGNTPDIEKTGTGSGAFGEIELTMKVKFSTEANVTFTIPPITQATKAELEAHDASHSAHDERFRAKADSMDFIEHVNDSSIHVTPEAMGAYQEAIAGLETALSAHAENQDIHVTATQKQTWTQGAATAATAEAEARAANNAIKALEGRVASLEDAVYNNITGNPFSVAFDSLEGIVLTKGIWNADRHRLEC